MYMNTREDEVAFLKKLWLKEPVSEINAASKTSVGDIGILLK